MRPPPHRGSMFRPLVVQLTMFGDTDMCYWLKNVAEIEMPEMQSLSGLVRYEASNTRVKRFPLPLVLAFHLVLGKFHI